MAELDSILLLSSPAGFSLASPNSSSSSSSDTEEDVNQGFDRRVNHRYAENSNRVDFPLRGNASIAGLELSVSCFTMVLIFWFFVSMALIVGVYGPKNVWIGPNSSILVEPNSIFVQSIKVKQLDDSKSGLQLFGFYRSPPLDVFVNWSESRLLLISHQSYKGWPYYLNKGTSLSISYSVKPEGSSAQLVVSEGMQGGSQWLNEDAYRNTAFSWSLIEGSGMTELKISKSSSYYVAVANLNMKDVEVELDMDVRAVLYDTRQSFYKCSFSNGECTFNAMYLVGNSVVLTSPAPRQGASIEEEWYIRLSYQPRWIAYIISTGAVICFVLLALQFCKRLQCGGGEGYLDDSAGSQRAGVLANKDEDGSSNESFAEDDADLEEIMGTEGEASKSNRRLCAICYDSPRDCFFLPCGHCVSCYQCGTKVAEAGGCCPICRRDIKKVRRIYTM